MTRGKIANGRAENSPSQLTLKTALKHLQANSALVKMFTNASPEGFAWYVVPGGCISDELAASIIKRPDVKASYDGLFPEHDQTWRMIR